MRDWHGPYCGFQEVELSIGHIHYSVHGGHYGAYLEEEFPAGRELFRREKALLNLGYYETWHNAMPEEHHSNTWVADRTIEMIDRFASGRFFVHCSFPDPHHPLSACEPYASLYKPEEMPEPLAPSLEELAQLPPVYRAYHLGEENYFAHPPSFPEKIAGAPLREMMAQMYGMVTHVDVSVGRVLEHLSARGLLDETLVLFTTDHGELMGDHGFVLKGPFYYQSLLNVPLIAKLPGAKPAVCGELVAHVDLVPTILECLGLEVPKNLPGRSLKRYLDGSTELTEVCRAGAHRDAVLTEFRPFGGPNMKVLHSGEWRYVYYAGEAYGELFNLRDDPEERRNLFGDPAYVEVERRLQARLLEELVLTEAAWPSRGLWL
jgi:arylsulfatase A-like enzyme